MEMRTDPDHTPPFCPSSEITEKASRPQIAQCWAGGVLPLVSPDACGREGDADAFRDAVAEPAELRPASVSALGHSVQGAGPGGPATQEKCLFVLVRVFDSS